MYTKYVKRWIRERM